MVDVWFLRAGGGEADTGETWLGRACLWPHGGLPQDVVTS